MFCSKLADIDHLPFLSPGFLEPYLICFVKELEEQGYSDFSRRNYAESIAHFGTWLTTNDVALPKIDEEVVLSFARHHCHCPGGRRQRVLSKRYVKRVVRFVTYLVQHGAINPMKMGDTKSDIPALITRFIESLRQRGLSVVTIDHYERSILELFPLLGDKPEDYSATCIRQVICGAAKTHSIPAIKTLITALRSFLRFLSVESLCVPDLDCAVPKVAQWSLSSMPRYISPQEVECVIHSCSADTDKGLRDRAIILLLARLGLRARDIVNMQLSDIDWENGTVRVSGKGHREDLLPLPQEVGDAVVTYIDQARPIVPITQLFLCLNAPHRAMGSSSTVSGVVGAALFRADILNPPSRGAHLLRHSAATNMLRSGMTLDNVSSMLRHRSLDMTAYYAKVDVPRLRQIAQPWPEVTSC